MRGKTAHAGFTYIGLLIAVALMGIILVSLATVWHQAQQRENEKQLLFIGNQFRQAIGSYYESSPGPAKQFPKKLADLVEDKRMPFIARHLRKIFHDPFTGSTDWGLIKGADNEILGVYSKTDIEPIKKTNFDKQYAKFENKLHYSEWKFVYVPGSTPAVAVAENGSATPPPPAEVIPPEYQPHPVPPANTNSPDDQKNRLCSNMNRNDLGICLNMLKKFGDAAGATCLASAASRYAVCLNGNMLSPLAVQYQ